MMPDRNHHPFGALRAALIAGVALVALMPADAQTGTTPPPAPAADEATSAQIEEVVVTAQKRSENAQNVPIAITALSSAQLAASGVADTSDLKTVAPALNVTQATGGFGLPRIRGIGATGQGPGIENPVALYIDGVYYGAAFGVLQSLFDTDQVAVLKGPQGTLFGRNATGGLIQIQTMSPSDTLKAKGEIGYGNYNTFTAGGFVSGGLTKTIALSLSGQYEKRRDGFGTNLFTGNDIQASESGAMRGKLLWDIASGTSALLSADFSRRNASEPAFRNFTLNSLGQNVTSQIIALGGDTRRDIFADVDPLLRSRQWGGSLTLSHDFGAATLKSITAYRKTKLRVLFDPDGTTQRRTVIDNNFFDKQFTQELNLVSERGRTFEWVIGGFYMWNSAGGDPARTSGTTLAATTGPAGFSDNITDVRLHSLAGFAEGTLHIGDATNLIAGVRYTHDKRDLSAFGRVFNSATNITTTSATITDDHTFEKVTWRLSVDHRFSPDLLVYASYNRGFRSGTYIAQATPIVLLRPEVVDAFEIGLKSDLFDRRVRFNLAAYYYDETNIQVQQVISGVQNVYNADGAKIHGIDGDVTWKVTNNVRLFGGFNYTHARYKTFQTAILSYAYPLPAGFVIPAGQTCLGTFGNAFAQLGGNCLLRGDASGNKLQNTPTFTASIGGSLDIPTASLGKFTLAGNYYYNDGFVGTPDERVAQPHYNTADASLTWRLPGDTFYVRAWGKNLTNAFYRTQIGATNTGDNGTYAAPRTYGATVGFSF